MADPVPDGRAALGAGPGPPDHLSRRSFLRAGAGIGVSLVASSCRGPHRSATGPTRTMPGARRHQPGSLAHPELPAGTDTIPQIDHIVVLMLENHSYDNYLGMLRRRGAGGFTLASDGRPTASNPYADGRIQHAFGMPTTCQLGGKPSQSWVDSHVQYDRGRNDGFVRSASGPVALGYWAGDDLPFYYGLASTFPVGDRYFSSLLGPRFPTAGTCWQPLR